MGKVALTGGFYQARSIIAGAQRCVNLIPEANESGSPFPFTTYLAPGLNVLASPNNTMWRCLYTASTGKLYGVANIDGVNAGVYYISNTFSLTQLGTIAAGNNPVSMSDNRLVIILVDGSSSGYYIDLTNNNAFGSIVNAAFYGADRVDYIDTFFVFNQPNTANWYISASELSAQLITGGGVLTGTIYGGSGYSNGTFTTIGLTGGSGSSATADIVVSANSVIGVTIDYGGGPYQVGDVLSASSIDLGGGITGQTVVGGVGYTAGTYTNVGLIGGTGSNAAATIVVAGGIVTTCTITNQGQQYSVADILTANAGNIGGTGTGFQCVVSKVNTGGAGFTYTVTSVQSGSLGFNPLNIAAKSGGSDTLATLIAIHDEVWLIGQKTSEVWYDAGTPDFSFGKLPGVFIEHGTVAKYSLAKSDLTCFWLGLDPQGHGIVFKGSQYAAQRISTFAIENVIQNYNQGIADAIGFTYQENGHTFYFLTFPSADATWVYDLATELWHERVWSDTNGGEHRHRANCHAFAYAVHVVGDWQTGQLYAWDPNKRTDAGQPIERRRGFPHIVNEGKRLSYDRFIAEMDVGGSVGTMDTPDAVLGAPGGSLEASGPTAQSLLAVDFSGFQSPAVSLRASFTKGASWGNPVPMPLGASGDYGTSMQRRQLGMGRDCVFELFWTGDVATALNGAYLDVSPAET